MSRCAFAALWLTAGGACTRFGFEPAQYTSARSDGRIGDSRISAKGEGLDLAKVDSGAGSDGADDLAGDRGAEAAADTVQDIEGEDAAPPEATLADGGNETQPDQGASARDAASLDLSALPPTRLSFAALPFDLAAHDALPSNNVRAVAYAGTRLYAGTEWGLASSDDGGRSWRTWTPRAGVGHSEIHHLRGGSAGEVWVATYAGLYFSPGGVTSFSSVGGTGNGFCSAWANATFGMGQDLYVPTLCGFSVSHDGGVSFTNRNTSDGLPVNGAVGVFADGLDVYVATTKGLGVSHDGGVRFSTLTTADGLPSNSVRDVSGRPGGAIYVATAAGLAIGTPGNWAIQRSAQGLPHDDLRRVTIGGTRVAAATAGGVAWSDDEGVSWTAKTTAAGLPSNDVRDVALRSASVAVASGAGVATSDDQGSSWSVAQAANGLSSIDARGVAYFAGQVLWATNSGLQVSKDEGLTWRRLSTADGLPGNDIRGLHAHAGVLYVGTDQGLAFGPRLDSLTVVDPTQLPSSSIRGVYANGRAVYLATDGGVAVQVGGASWVAYGTGAGLASNAVTAVHAEGDTICAASAVGLALSFDHGQSWRMRTTADGLRHNVVHGCFVAGGSIYAATQGGLSVSADGGQSWTYRVGSIVYQVKVVDGVIYACTLTSLSVSYDGTRFESYAVRDGLPYWTVRGVDVTATAVYAATPRGVARALR